MVNRHLATKTYTGQIDEWIKLALEKKVQKIELNLSRDIHFSMDYKTRNINTPLRLQDLQGDGEWYDVHYRNKIRKSKVFESLHVIPQTPR